MKDSPVIADSQRRTDRRDVGSYRWKQRKRFNNPLLTQG